MGVSIMLIVLCLNSKGDWYIAIGAIWRHTQQAVITVVTSAEDCSTQPQGCVTM